MNHWISFFVRKRSQTGRYIFQHLHKNTSQTTKYHVTELLFIFCANKQFRTFQHRLYHNCSCIRYLHHTIKFQCQMLLTFNVQNNTADIWFVHRTNHFGNYRKSAPTGKSYYLLFIIGNKFIYQRNTGSMQQCLYIIGSDITILRNRINNTTNPRNVYSEQFYFRNCRFRSIDDTWKGSTQGHFVCKIHMPFCQEGGNLRSGCINGRKNGKNRFLASLHLFVKHIIHFKHSNQSRSSEDGHHGVYIVKLFLAVVNAKAQMFRCSGSQNINRISDGSTGE